MKSIYYFKDYKKFLLTYLEYQPQKGRGLRGKWAAAANCQPAYISNVLGSTPHFNLEQAEAISTNLGHSVEETEYFLLLIERARAGTPSLKQFFQKIIEQRQQHHHSLRNRVQIQSVLRLEDQAVYYSKWQFAAVHMILTIPEYQSVESIANYFALSLPEVKVVLNFLSSRHLIEETATGRFKVLDAFLHIDSASPLFMHQQVIWRHKSIESIYRDNPSDLHFASCFSISFKDLERIKDLLGQAIQDTAQIIKPSKEEKLFSICLDFFEVR
jgi:uncharacterized protein (TIGR02147 family)